MGKALDNHFLHDLENTWINEKKLLYCKFAVYIKELKTKAFLGHSYLKLNNLLRNDFKIDKFNCLLHYAIWFINELFNIFITQCILIGKNIENRFDPSGSCISFLFARCLTLVNTINWLSRVSITTSYTWKLAYIAGTWPNRFLCWATKMSLENFIKF